MSRRCIGCQRLYGRELRACPACGESGFLFVTPPALRADFDGMRVCSCVLAVNAVLILGAMGKAPSFWLQTSLFIDLIIAGLCLGGIESATRSMRTKLVASVFLYVALGGATGQWVFYGLVTTGCVIMLGLTFPDQSRSLVGASYRLAIVQCVLFTALTIAGWAGFAVPGWWEGRDLAGIRVRPELRGDRP